ncbi:anti-sigma-I factor RsgI3 [Abditibacteriota bacterium]|nr:anti-sigma-I factor RsgI3 [Abditibacteriota bacterium]
MSFIYNAWSGRLARAQRFSWNPDGTPNFGFPIPAAIRLNVPSGEVGSTPQKAFGGTGLRAQYFSSQGTTPSFTTPLATENGQNVDVNWNMSSPHKVVPADHFAVRWIGQIQPRYSGLYTFQTFADDGIRVSIDSKNVIDAFAPGTARATRGFIYLEAKRKYPLQVDYLEIEVAARASLYWQSENQAFEVVPRDCLFPPAN